MPSVADVAVSVTAKTAAFEANMKSAAKTSKSSFKSMGADIALFANAFKLLAVGAVLKETIGAFNRIDVSLKKIDASTNSFKRNQNELKAVALSVYKSIPVSMDAATASVITLANRTNLSGDAFKQAAEQAAQFSKVSGGDVKDLIDGTVRSLNQWGVSADNVAVANDLLFRITKQTGISIGELQDELKDGADTLQMIGMSYKDASIFIGQLKANGMDAAEVFKGVKTAIDGLVANGATDIPSSFKNLARYVRDAKNDTEAWQRASEVFGKKAGPAMAQLFFGMKGDISEARKELEKLAGINGTENSTRSALDSIGQTLKGYADDATMVMSTLDDALKTLQPVVKALVEVFAGLVKVLAGAVKAVDNVIKTSITENDYAKYIGKSASSIGDNFKAIFSPGAQLGDGAKLYDQLNAPSKPQYHVENGKFVKSAFTVSYQSATDYMKSMEKAAKAAAPASAAVADATAEVAQAAAQTATELQKENEALGGTTTAANDAAKSMDYFGKKWTQVANGIEGESESFTGTLVDGLMDVQKETAKAGDAFRSMALSIIESIEKIILTQMIAEPLVRGIMGMFGLSYGGSNAAYSQAAVGGMDTSWMNSSSDMGGFSWYGTGHAAGGNVTAGVGYPVGERGPELFVPNVNGAIIPNAGGGGVTVYQTFNIQAGTPEAIKIAAREAASQVRQQAPTFVADQVNRGGRLSRAIRQ